MGISFGMAAVLEFGDSLSFPSQEELSRCKRETGSHSLVMLSKFKEWSNSSSEDVAFKYYAQMFTLFGPLQQMYLYSIRFGQWLGREASWMLMHPLFAQSNKRNYHTEAMVHIVNFVAAWPLALRELLRKNCSISLNGKEGYNLALDEWVESCVVQPMKNYATGLYKILSDTISLPNLFFSLLLNIQKNFYFQIRLQRPHACKRILHWPPFMSRG